MNQRKISTLVSLCRSDLRTSMSYQTLVILAILCFGKVLSKTQQYSADMYSSQPLSNSYSQVRFSSTRRNGTYDSLSFANNPALANHRLQMQSNNQPMYVPAEENKSSLSHSVLQQPSAVEVQSAIKDAIQQDTIVTTPAGGLDALFANFYPQFTDAFQNQAPPKNPLQEHNDLHHLPSVVHKVSVEPPMLIDHAAQSSHGEMPHHEEHIREYHHDSFNGSFVQLTPSAPVAHNPLLIIQPTNSDKHHYFENKPNYNLAEKEIEHMVAAPPLDLKKSYLDRDSMTSSHIEEDSAPIINEHLNADENVNSTNNNGNRRIDSDIKQTTDCPQCRLFHEEMLKTQQHIKISAAAENSIPLRDNIKVHALPVTTQIPKEETTFLSTNNEILEISHPNFSAPVINEIFSISDALIPQVGPPSFPNSSRLIPQNNIFPQNVPVNNFQPQILQPNIPNPVPPVPQLQKVPMVPLPGHSLQSIHNRDSLSNVPTASQSNRIPLRQQPISLENIQNVQFLPPSPIPGNKQKPIAVPLPSQMLVQNAGSFISTSHTRNQVLPSQFLQSSSNRNADSLKPLMSHPVFQSNSHFIKPLPNMLHHSPVENSHFHQNGYNLQKVDVTPPGIHGPMGIRIPIPPKTVPAHSVMAPPISLPPILGSTNPPPPPRRNGGIFDSLMNFLGGGRNQNRGRSLDQDDAFILNETYEIENGTLFAEENTNISESKIHIENLMLEANNETSRVRRATILDQLPDYLDGLFKRFSNDVKKFTSPLIPSLRDAIRNSALSRYIYGEEEMDKTKQSNGLWTLFLDSYTQSSSSATSTTATSKHDPYKSEASRINKVHELLSSNRKNFDLKRSMNKSSSLNFLPPCVTDEGMPFCLKDEHYPKAFLTNMLLQLKKIDIKIQCNITKENVLTIPKSFSTDLITCESPEQKIQPLRAKNIEGVWKIIVNIPNHCEQFIGIKKCHPSCMNCNEVKNTFKLLTFDKEDGFQNDNFQFASGCSCTP